MVRLDEVASGGQFSRLHSRLLRLAHVPSRNAWSMRAPASGDTPGGPRKLCRRGWDPRLAQAWDSACPCIFAEGLPWDGPSPFGGEGTVKITLSKVSDNGGVLTSQILSSLWENSAMRKLAKPFKSNFFRTLKWTKCLQQSGEHLFNKNSWISEWRVSLQHSILHYFHTPFCSSTVF